MFDKFPFQRILVLFTLFSVSLTACTHAPALTPTATMPVETSKPSATATKASTATATPDVNMPEGATGKNAKGEYIKETAEGTFTWTVLKDETGKEVVSLWAASHINPGTSDLRGGIPLGERSDDTYYPNDLDPLYILAAEGFDTPYFSHPDYPDTGTAAGISSFTQNYNTILWKGSGLSPKDFARAEKNGTLSISFTNGKSKFTWETVKGVVFIGMKPEELTSEKFPDLTIIKSADLMDRDLKFHWTAFTNEKHQLVILSTVDDTSSMDNTQWLRMVIGPFGQVTKGKIEQSGVSFLETQRLVRYGLREQNPHFVIGPKQ